MTYLEMRAIVDEAMAAGCDNAWGVLYYNQQFDSPRVMCEKVSVHLQWRWRYPGESCQFTDPAEARAWLKRQQKGANHD